MPTLIHEIMLHDAGYKVVAGVDEAGRGPLAGPVCVAAVILPLRHEIQGLDDSKKLSPQRRERLFEEITSNPDITWNCVAVQADEIDQLNILKATHEGMRRAMDGLRVMPDAVLIDGLPVPNFPVHQLALVGGDAISQSIAAASIIAKVTRDRWMVGLGKRYPGYGFEIHKGYPTKAHLESLEYLGACAEHRRSFRPVRAVMQRSADAD